MLKKFEKDVLEQFALRAGDFADSFRSQLNHAEVASREFTGRGFFTYLSVPDLPSIRKDIPDCSLSGTGGSHPTLRHGADFILHIRDGVLNMLEGYAFGGQDWPGDDTQFTIHDLPV